VLRRNGEVGEVPKMDDVEAVVLGIGAWPGVALAPGEGAGAGAGNAAGEVGELENRAVLSTRSLRSSRERTSDSVRIEMSSVPAIVFGSDARVLRAVIIGFIVVCRRASVQRTKDGDATG